MISCKSNYSIVTSKNDAKRKGVYTKAASTRATQDVESIETQTASIKSIKNINSKPSDILINQYSTHNYNNYSPNTEIYYGDVIKEAKNYLGVRYRSGGTTRAGMDCSGLVSTVFKQFDFTLPRSSKDMAKIGVTIKKNNIAPGDLVFFKTNGRSVINHVGIVVDVNGDEFKFIHSSTSRGVIISSNTEPYYKKSYVQANRVL
jgi:murein DD-endopeptidase / murein LD-carboxypeptidase